MFSYRRKGREILGEGILSISGFLESIFLNSLRIFLKGGDILFGGGGGGGGVRRASLGKEISKCPNQNGYDI